MGGPWWQDPLGTIKDDPVDAALAVLAPPVFIAKKSVEAPLDAVSSLAPEPPDPLKMPEASPEEQRLMDLNIQMLEKALEPLEQTPEQIALEKKQGEYFQTLTEEQTLSAEEEAEFTKEYDLQVESLREQHGLELGKASNRLYADLVARGVADSTTGEDIQSELTGRYGESLQSSIGELGLSMETAKSDVGAAKKEMALQGYKMMSDIQQSNLDYKMNLASTTQNYLSTNRSMTASTALQNSMMKQMSDQYAYQMKMGGLGALGGAGLKLLGGK